MSVWYERSRLQFRVLDRPGQTYEYIDTVCSTRSALETHILF